MKIVSYIRWIFIIVIGIAVAVYGVKERVSMGKEGIDLNDPDLDWSELKDGDHVEMDVKYLFSEFETVTDKNGNESARKYAMPRIVYDEDSEGWFIVDFIGVNANKTQEYASYDALVDEMHDWWFSDDVTEYNPTTVHLDGIVRKMQDDDIGFFAEYLKDAGYEDDELDDTMYQYCIYPAQSHNGLIIGIGAVVALLGVAALSFKVIKTRKA